MNELVLKTETDRRIDQIDAALVETLAHTHAAVQALNDGYRALWDASDEVLLAIINRWGVQKTLAVFATHNAAGVAYNQVLDSRPEPSLPTRAIVVAGRAINVGSDGLWYVVPVDPEPAPDPVE